MLILVKIECHRNFDFEKKNASLKTGLTPLTRCATISIYFIKKRQ